MVQPRGRDQEQHQQQWQQCQVEPAVEEALPKHGVVHQVLRESPAQAAGLERHDVLHRLDDQILVNPRQLIVLVRQLKQGDQVKLAVIRDAQPLELIATVDERSEKEVGSLPFAVFCSECVSIRPGS